MKKKTFTLADYYSDFNHTDLTREIGDRFSDALQPLFEEYLKKGHNHFLLEQIASSSVHEMLLRTSFMDFEEKLAKNKKKPAKKSTKKKTKKKASK